MKDQAALGSGVMIISHQEREKSKISRDGKSKGNRNWNKGTLSVFFIRYHIYSCPVSYSFEVTQVHLLKTPDKKGSTFY